MSRDGSIRTADDDGDASRDPLVTSTNQKPLYVDKNILMKSRVYTPKRIGHPIRVNSCVRDCDPPTVHSLFAHPLWGSDWSTCENAKDVSRANTCKGRPATGRCLIRPLVM